MKLKFVVEAEYSGWRLDKFLSGQYPALSRSGIQNLIEAGLVQVNDVIVTKKGFALSAADLVVMPTESIEEPRHLAEDIELDVRFEDESLLVVNKPAGMVVHPAPGHRDNTLVNALLGRGSELSDSFMRPGIVHRLDKDTSGLLLVAKSNTAHRLLADMLKARQIKRTYLAVVRGNLMPKQGTIEGPIGRHPRVRTKMAIVRGGKNAVTHYQVLREFSHYTLVRVRLETGRTHQIRVHFSQLGHPIAGDKVYSRCREQLAAHLLHSRTLEFAHPVSGAQVRVTAEPPLEFLAFLRKLVQGSVGGQQ